MTTESTAHVLPETRRRAVRSLIARALGAVHHVSRSLERETGEHATRVELDTARGYVDEAARRLTVLGGLGEVRPTPMQSVAAIAPLARLQRASDHFDDAVLVLVNYAPTERRRQRAHRAAALAADGINHLSTLAEQ